MEPRPHQAGELAEVQNHGLFFLIYHEEAREQEDKGQNHADGYEEQGRREPADPLSRGDVCHNISYQRLPAHYSIDGREG